MSPDPVGGRHNNVEQMSLHELSITNYVEQMSLHELSITNHVGQMMAGQSTNSPLTLNIGFIALAAEKKDVLPM